LETINNPSVPNRGKNLTGKNREFPIEGIFAFYRQTEDLRFVIADRPS
jgi:hypothetical protein